MTRHRDRSRHFGLKKKVFHKKICNAKKKSIKRFEKNAYLWTLE
jgi:hypothetical protein